MSERDPQDHSIDGVDADPQGSNFVASFRDNRGLKIQADSHASVPRAPVRGASRRRGHQEAPAADFPMARKVDGRRADEEAPEPTGPRMGFALADRHLGPRL